MATRATRKFSRDYLWNVAGLGVAGVAGVALNYLIAEVYGAAALGSFNQVFAVYILSSQFAVFGVHLSVLQGIAVADEPSERGKLATSAVLVATVQASATAALLLALAPAIGGLLESPNVSTGLVAGAPGIVFFAVNKVLIGGLNGLRRMRWYAVLSAARFVFMFAACVACALLRVQPGKLPIILTVSEAATLALAALASRHLFARLSWRDFRRRAGAHLSFGSRGFLGGVLAEANTRIDVVMLGYFADDRIVGIYSFAAIVAEGMMQFLIVLRSNYAAVVAPMIARGSRAALTRLIRRGRNRTYLAAVPVGALSIAAYALLVPMMTSDPSLDASWVYFAILAGGIVSASGYIPFTHMLMLARRPGWQTCFTLAVVSANIAANAALIPSFGALGAGIATAGALAMSVVFLKLLCRRLLSISI